VPDHVVMQIQCCIAHSLCFSIQFQDISHAPKNVLLELSEENRTVTCDVIDSGVYVFINCVFRILKIAY